MNCTGGTCTGTTVTAWLLACAYGTARWLLQYSIPRADSQARARSAVPVLLFEYYRNSTPVRYTVLLYVPYRYVPVCTIRIPWYYCTYFCTVPVHVALYCTRTTYCTSTYSRLYGTTSTSRSTILQYIVVRHVVRCGTVPVL